MKVNLDTILKLATPIIVLAVAWGVMKNELEHFDTRITKVETKIEQLDETFVKIEVRLAEIQKDIQSINSKLDEVK